MPPDFKLIIRIAQNKEKKRKLEILNSTNIITTLLRQFYKQIQHPVQLNCTAIYSALLCQPEYCKVRFYSVSSSKVFFLHSLHYLEGTYCICIPGLPAQLQFCWHVIFCFWAPFWILSAWTVWWIPQAYKWRDFYFWNMLLSFLMMWLLKPLDYNIYTKLSRWENGENSRWQIRFLSFVSLARCLMV